MAGLPRVGATPHAATGALRVGERLETDDSSRAVILVGDIGHVEVRPDTRIRLIRAQRTDHRLALDREGSRQVDEVDGDLLRTAPFKIEAIRLLYQRKHVAIPAPSDGDTR